MASDVSGCGGARPRLLLVEDEELTRGSLRRLLGASFSVVDVRSAVEALAIVARAEPFAVVLADLNLDDAIDGLMLYETLRSVYPAAYGSFVLMTSGDVPPRAEHLVDERVIGFLRKPFCRADALAVLMTFVKDRGLVT